MIGRISRAQATCWKARYTLQVSLSRVPLFWSDEYWELENTRSGVKPRRMERDGHVLFLGLFGETIHVPGSATFGGWWQDPKNYSAGQIPSLFDHLFEEFPNMRWQFRFPPSHFFPTFFDSQITYLQALGGRLVREQNSAILRRNLGSDEVATKFSRGNRKRVRSFRESGGVVRTAKPEEYRAAFTVLSESRERRGVSLSMTWEAFCLSLHRLPRVYRCWLALKGSEVVGAALTVDVSQQALYVLYWGDTPLGREQSVTATICERLATFAWDQNKEVLDLGISSVDGKIDEGLLRFKRNLGATDFDQWTVSLGSSR